MLVHWYDKDKMLNVMLIYLGLFYGWVCFFAIYGICFFFFVFFCFCFHFVLRGQLIHKESLDLWLCTHWTPCMSTFVFVFSAHFFFYFTELMPSYMSVSYHRLLSFVYLFVDVE